jgi:hypothetical protein
MTEAHFQIEAHLNNANATSQSQTENIAYLVLSSPFSGHNSPVSEALGASTS